MNNENKKILITGAGGFVGGFLVEEALKRGFETWAAVRATTSREFLSDERIRFIELDFTDPDKLRSTLADAIEKNGKWDYVLHNLGATKCNNFRDFDKINNRYMRSLVDTLISLDAVPERFLLMSSLSAMGEGDEENYAPFTEKGIPMPNTAYGVSKINAEQYLWGLKGFPYIILRPTGVYGPHEKDYFMMIKSIRNCFDFSVGMKEQMLTFIYVKDLAAAALDALEKSPERSTYIISEERAYTQKEFRKIVLDTLGKKFVIPIKIPLWLLYIVSNIAGWWGGIVGKPSTLNPDKYKIMKQRNWNCSVEAAKRGFGFAPKYTLSDGIRESIAWYRENGWL